MALLSTLIFRKMRMKGGFPVSGKRQHIRHRPVRGHAFQPFFQSRAHFFTCGQRLLGTKILVEPTLTIHTIERTPLPVFRKQVDAQRNTQPTAVHRSEYGRRINHCSHNFVFNSQIHAKVAQSPSKLVTQQERKVVFPSPSDTLQPVAYFLTVEISGNPVFPHQHPTARHVPPGIHRRPHPLSVHRHERKGIQ